MGPNYWPSPENRRDSWVVSNGDLNHPVDARPRVAGIVSAGIDSAVTITELSMESSNQLKKISSISEWKETGFIEMGGLHAIEISS